MNKSDKINKGDKIGKAQVFLQNDGEATILECIDKIKIQINILKTSVNCFLDDFLADTQSEEVVQAINGFTDQYREINLALEKVQSRISQCLYEDCSQRAAKNMIQMIRCGAFDIDSNDLLDEIIQQLRARTAIKS